MNLVINGKIINTPVGVTMLHFKLKAVRPLNAPDTYEKFASSTDAMIHSGPGLGWFPMAWSGDKHEDITRQIWGIW